VSAYEDDLHMLMTLGLKGDAGAYRRFLEQLGGMFRAFFRRKLQSSDAALAEDLVQETLLAIHLHRLSYDPSRRITAWVYAIARYKLIDHYRRSPASRQFVPVDDVDDLFSEDEPDAADPARDVAALLKHLPAKQSAAIRLVKLEQLTSKEAAKRMGVSEADVKINIHRGLKKLMDLAGGKEVA
jgi:RNA polymerase sigma-70 factor (ECF subfamily)